MGKKDEKTLELTTGSRYKITSLSSRDNAVLTSGTFKGYISLGSEEGMIMELDDSHEELKGNQRVLPIHMILFIDILEALEAEEDEESRLNAERYLY